MAFFDLSVPYLEPKGANNSASTVKAERLKVVVKAMELGYSGVAYNRSIRGVMSDRDRCTIPPFPLSSLLKVAPTLSTSVRFHRQLLGVPISGPFRQFRRLTVAADAVAQVAALNSGNPILRTYDLVAIRPLSQSAFDQACNVAEVDLIAIDFSQKLPFRLKLPMVKAAIERGICFEITYSHFILNVQSRKQFLSGAKLLVDWSRGKNIIFSSAATSADEVRGPYDVANLLSLLGLSPEKAKAAISKNCSVLLETALRKKQFYKEAIRIEKLSHSEQLDSTEKILADWGNWDAISSGDGDIMPMEDLAKHFSDATKAANDPIKVGNNPFKELNLYSTDNASHDLFSWRQENLIPPDNNATLTQEMQSGNKSQWLGQIDNDVSPKGRTGQGCTLLSSTHAKPAEDLDSQGNELEKSNDLDFCGTSAPTSINSTSNNLGSGYKPSSLDKDSIPASSQLVDSLNMDTRNLGCSGEIVTFSGEGSPISCVPVIGVTNVSPCNKAEEELARETHLSFALETSEYSPYQIGTKTLTAQETILSPNTRNTVDTAASVENNKKSTLASCTIRLHDSVMTGTSRQAEANILPKDCNASEHEGAKNAIIRQKEGRLKISDAMLIDGGSDGLNIHGGVLALPAADVHSKENRDVPSSRKKRRSRKEKPGRGKFIQKLRCRARHFPSRGLFKPLLFRRKGCSKRYSTINHDTQW